MCCQVSAPDGRELNKAVMPWDYHTGHIYKAMLDVIVSEFGQEGEEIMAIALAEFAGRYGEGAARILETYKEADFHRLPE